LGLVRPADGGDGQADEMCNCSRASTIPRRDAPELFPVIVPLVKRERAQGKPGADCTRGPRATKSTGVGPQVNRSNAGFPCAVVYGLLRALPGDRAFLPPSPPRSVLLGSLTPASGRQDHTTSPSARSGVRLRRHPRPPHPTATFVTWATPLLSGGTRGLRPLICPTTEAEFFCAGGWTRFCRFARRVNLSQAVRADFACRRGDATRGHRP